MLLNKKLTLSLIGFLLTTCLFAQEKQEKEDKPKTFKHELGLNVTNLLTDLLGNNNRTNAGDYLISYKKVNGNKAFRMGATVNISIKKENVFNNNNTLTNQNFQLRLGKEWRYNLSSKLQYYFGIDGITGFKSEQSSASITNTTIIQTDKAFSLGGGPVLGFQFALLDRLLLGTEGAVYAAFNKNEVKFSGFGINTSQFPAKNSQGINFQTHLPKFLFLIIKF